MPVLSKDKLAPCSSMHEFGVELACVASSAIPVQSSLPPPRKARLLQNQINLFNLIRGSVAWSVKHSNQQLKL